MTYTPTNAVYRLNSYVWKVLEANLGWSESDYSNGTPFLPSAQQPELIQTGKPFIVYSSATGPNGFLYALKSESVSYTIYGEYPADVDIIVNLLERVFESADDAAANINQHLHDEGLNKGVSFCSAETTMIEKADAPDQEGGMVSAHIMFRITYVQHNDANLKLSGFTYP